MTRRPPRPEAPANALDLLVGDRHWAAITPAEGWTSRTAASAAIDFAPGDRRLAFRAFRALVDSLPEPQRTRFVHEWIDERLRYEDPVAELIQAR